MAAGIALISPERRGRRRSRRDLAGIFDAYGGEEFDFRFEKTRVKALLAAGGEGGLISRSQARRFLDRVRASLPLPPQPAG